MTEFVLPALSELMNPGVLLAILSGTVVGIIVGAMPGLTATMAVALLIPVTFLGRLRAKMGLVGNAWFKRSHPIAYAAWPFATAHYVLAGTDALAEWSLALLFAGTALIVMGLLARGFIPAPGPQRQITEKPTLTSS